MICKLVIMFALWTIGFRLRPCKAPVKNEALRACFFWGGKVEIVGKQSQWSYFLLLPYWVGHIKRECTVPTAQKCYLYFPSWKKKKKKSWTKHMYSDYFSTLLLVKSSNFSHLAPFLISILWIKNYLWGVI